MRRTTKDTHPSALPRSYAKVIARKVKVDSCTQTRPDIRDADVPRDPPARRPRSAQQRYEDAKRTRAAPTWRYLKKGQGQNVVQGRKWTYKLETDASSRRASASPAAASE